MHKKDGSTVAIVRSIAQPIAESLGLSLWDIRFVKEGAGWYLRFFIDKDGGVSLDDCVDFSHAIDKPLDEADPIEQNYFLEVSSPGLERDLVKDFHFAAVIGQRIKLRLIRPKDNKRNFAGILEDYTAGTLTVRLEDNTVLTIDKKETSTIKLDDFDNFGGIER
ncbi:MAG: ribosome maturation factor RimP [Clostridiales bacterium]|nr:ribosome maturation factor RimP [Clostridiales bacterium]